MKIPLVIFGTGEIAELALYYFNNDSNYEVVAFTVDSDYLVDNKFNNLPIITFDDIHKYYPPSKYHLFIALSYSNLNSIRKQKYIEGKNKGYDIASYVSSHTTIFNNTIGENCFILEDNTIQPFVTIGNNITLWSGNHIGHHTIIRDHCFIASHVVISGGVDIGESCFIGVNATLRDHIKIGEKSILGAGTLILSDTDICSVYIGHASKKAKVSSLQLKNI